MVHINTNNLWKKNYCIELSSLQNVATQFAMLINANCAVAIQTPKLLFLALTSPIEYLILVSCFFSFLLQNNFNMLEEEEDIDAVVRRILNKGKTVKEFKF